MGLLSKGGVIELPLSECFWRRTGGEISESWPLVDKQAFVPATPRWPDGLIVLGRPARLVAAADLQPAALKGEDVLVVQTKAGKASIELAGRALVALFLARHRLRGYPPRSLETIAFATSPLPAPANLVACEPIRFKYVSAGECPDLPFKGSRSEPSRATKYVKPVSSKRRSDWGGRGAVVRDVPIVLMTHP
jgi:hypothetical protein